MKAVVVAALAAALSVGATGVSAGDSPPPVEQARPAPQLRNNCAALYSQRQFKHYARHVYRRRHVSKRAGRQVQTMMRCQHSPRAERKMRTFRRYHRAMYRVQRQIAAITPFGPCFGEKWAIPCWTIGRESSGGWNVVNRGCLARYGFFGPCARGPYQFLKKPVPWPVFVKDKLATLRRKLAHHRYAVRLRWQDAHLGTCHWCASG